MKRNPDSLAMYGLTLLILTAVVVTAFNMLGAT